ncbi:MAG: carboxypeptidase-like regulatory domain-containing protein [Candidatus Marinimicrobia bacterium]|nr:carboxypeptidase-like regulatory domain-containing protein [Candidatus Neomarinimicrobiota bacterium]
MLILTGKGLQDVSVVIEKTSYKSITDKNGNYSIDYAPGNFKLIYSKSGYTTEELELNLSTKDYYPADSILMYPIPKNKGIYYLDGNSLVSLYELKLKEREWKEYPKITIYSYIDNLPTDLKKYEINEKHITFIDTYPHFIKLAKVRREGIHGKIQHYSYYWSDVKYMYNGLVKYETKSVGKEKLLLKSAKLTPGIYAWVSVFENFYGNIHIKNDGTAFIFVVTANEY